MEINLHAAGTTLPIILTPEKCTLTWGELCQDVVHNFLTVADPRAIFKILTEICPTERLTHYQIRYGDGNSSIIRVDWSSTDITGFVPLPLSLACIDVNMVLRPQVDGPIQNLAKPHLPVQPVVSFPASVNLDLCISVASSSAEPPFPYEKDRMSVLYLKEHESFSGCVDRYEIMAADGYHDLLPKATCVPQVSCVDAAISADTPVAAGKKRKTPSTAAPVESKAQRSDKEEEGTCKSDDNDYEIMEKSVDKYDTSNKGELKSIVDPSFSRKYPGVMEAAFRVLDYLYLHPSHAPWVEGAGLLLAAESCYGNEAIMNLHRPHYLRQSFSKTDLSAIPADENTRECFVYGVGYGSSTFGTVAEQVAYREWTAEMQIIADAIEKELVHKFSADPSVDVNVHLNELEVISFYDWKKITFHRDQSYSAEGKFCSNNCQKQHTCTCIFVVGDERILEFQLFWGKQKVSHPEALKKITLSHGALFFLHPEDEEDAMRQIFEMNERTHFKHRNNGVKGGLLSIGLVFRACVQRRSVYKGTGQLVLTSKNSKSTKTKRKCERKMKEYEQCWSKRNMDEYLKDKYLSMKQRHHRG